MSPPPTPLDYATRRPHRASRWPFAVAHCLQVWPIVYFSFVGHPGPPPPEDMVLLLSFVAVAVGASLFVVRRRRRSVAGWLGLCLWGGITLLAFVGAALRR